MTRNFNPIAVSPSEATVFFERLLAWDSDGFQQGVIAGDTLGRKGVDDPATVLGILACPEDESVRNSLQHPVFALGALYGAIKAGEEIKR